jgi:hypothetical protein
VERGLISPEEGENRKTRMASFLSAQLVLKSDA